MSVYTKCYSHFLKTNNEWEIPKKQIESVITKTGVCEDIEQEKESL